MTMAYSIALLAFSAPITAAVIKYLPSKNGRKNGYLTKREYDKDMAGLGDKLGGIDSRLLDMNARIHNLTVAVKSHLK